MSFQEASHVCEGAVCAVEEAGGGYSARGAKRGRGVEKDPLLASWEAEDGGSTAGPPDLNPGQFGGVQDQQNCRSVILHPFTFSSKVLLPKGVDGDV